MRSTVSSAACHDQNVSPKNKRENRAGVEAAEPIIALVGSPNSGKTTLFNWLTGSKFKTVNYPGSTVEHSIGKSHDRYGSAVLIMDTPGVYSLDPKSPDERVTMNAIFEHKTFGCSRIVVSVADATLLSRHLLITRQLIDAGFEVILAVTMVDLLQGEGATLNQAELSKSLGIPVVLIDGRLGGGVKELVESVRQKLNQTLDKPQAQRPEAWSAEKVEATLRETEALAKRTVQALERTASASRVKTSARERSRTIDRVLLHPIWGLGFFFLLMTAIFSSVFWLATPLMDLIDQGFSALASAVVTVAPNALLGQFLSDGVIASVSAVLVFVPQIFILFLGIIVLEDSGYLARSATLIDRPLSKLGLGGRSFVPLLSGYACAVPAMMAARTITSRKERWLTLFTIPLMSCSARLPVYALLLAFLFHGDSAFKAGLALAAIYLGSLVVGAIAASIASRMIKFDDKSFFMLELPVYRRPKLSLVLTQALLRTKYYVMRAGPMIFLFALIVWLGTTFPRYDVEDKSERLNQSYAAQLGQSIEPVFEPMGGDWRTGVGLISAFAAREVFVSSLAVVFQIADEDENSMQTTLLEKMKEAKAPTGYPLFTLASVLGLIVFFMIALQCLSTFIIAVREAGTWKFAMLQLLLFNAVAYILAVAIVQGLRAAGVA